MLLPLPPPLIKQLHPCNDSGFPNSRGTTHARSGIFFMAANTPLKLFLGYLENYFLELFIVD